MPPRDTWERWDTPGNTHLLRYFAHHGPRLRRLYGADHHAEVAAIFNTAKKKWAQDMRDADRDGQPPADKGLAWFAADMAAAEADCITRFVPQQPPGDPK